MSWTACIYSQNLFIEIEKEKNATVMSCYKTYFTTLCITNFWFGLLQLGPFVEKIATGSGNTISQTCSSSRPHVLSKSFCFIQQCQNVILAMLD